MFNEREKESPCTHLKCSYVHSTYLESPVKSWDKVCPILNEFPGNPKNPADFEINYAFSRSYGS